MELPDRCAEYSLVRQLRQLIGTVSIRISEATLNDYMKKYQYIITSGKLPEHHNTKRAYYAYRAALIFGTAQTAREALRKRDKAVYGSDDWQTSMDALTKCAAVFNRYPPDPARKHRTSGSDSFVWESIKAHKIKTITGWSTTVASKRRLLSKLAYIKEWQTKFFESVTEKHKKATALCMLTGARPSEIARGVEITLVKQNNIPILVIRILGSKITETSGQPERILYVSVSRPESLYLAKTITQGKQTISTHPANLCAAFIKAGRKAFPDFQDTITPYVFRHQLASQLKAAEIDPATIAKILGHQATESQQAYGYAVSAKGITAPIVGVSASMPVRLTHRDPRSYIGISLAPSISYSI